MALSQPGGVKDAVGSVVPGSISGGKGANRYLSNMFATLRGCITTEDESGALKTLETLIKMWARNQSEEALRLVRTQKIGWGDVLRKGAPMTRKRDKGIDRWILTPPLKPSRTPWAPAGERSHLAQLCSPIWEKPEELRKTWLALEPEEQHVRYRDMVSRVREAYNEMSSISQAVHAKLGHRKRWIHSVCEEQAVAPSGKKNKSDPFKWSTAFFKLDLTKLNEQLKKVFNPAHYLEQRYKADEVYTWLCGQDTSITIPWITCPETDEPIKHLFKGWVERFQPNLKVSRTVSIPLQDVEVQNFFAELPDGEP